MPRSRKGSGSVFQRTYRDSKGKLRKTSNWYIEFVSGNRTVRESTDYTKRSDAAEFLKKRISDAMGGKIVLSRNVTYEDLCKLILVDYENNERNGQSALNLPVWPFRVVFVIAFALLALQVVAEIAKLLRPLRANRFDRAGEA